MNNEIKLSKKEIIGICEFLKIHHFENAYTLLDYITNLQQLEQEHKKINGELREENSKLEIALQNIQEDYDRRTKENERLKEEQEYNNYCDEQLRKKISNLEYKITTLENYKSRCEKASDKLGNYKHYSIPTEEQNSENEDIVDSALNILQNGSDKNV